jgi:hypothetical protein
MIAPLLSKAPDVAKLASRRCRRSILAKAGALNRFRAQCSAESIGKTGANSWLTPRIAGENARGFHLFAAGYRKVRAGRAIDNIKVGNANAIHGELRVAIASTVVNLEAQRIAASDHSGDVANFQRPPSCVV